MGVVERRIMDRAVDSLGEIARLDVRQMFSGFGLYVDARLVAAAWDGAFRLRYRENGHWVYKQVDHSVVDEPSLLVPLVRDRAAALAAEPASRRRR
jgi:hypothetical protein